MTYTQYFNSIQQAYLAYYQRPADPAGLRYWAQRTEEAGGNLAAVIDAFTTSRESRGLYGEINTSTVETVIQAAYKALFNRSPKADGKKFYLDGFAKGTFTAGGIVLDILAGAQNTDATVIANKLSVANEFTRIVDGRTFPHPDFGSGRPNPAFDGGQAYNATYAGDADAAAARNMLAKVDETVTTVDTRQLVQFIKKEIAIPGDPILKASDGPSTPKPADPPKPDDPQKPDEPPKATGGETFTLPAAAQYPLKGTDFDDIFEAPLDGNGLPTFKDGVSIDGGDGVDTLNIDFGNHAATLPADATIENINILNISTQSGSNLDIKTLEDLDEVNVTSTSDSSNIAIDGGKKISTTGGVVSVY